MAAALILTGMRKSTPVSEAQASSVLSSALPGGETEEPSSAAASSESAVSSEVTEESPVSSFLEQLEEELGISSSETASSSEVSSAASAGKADSCLLYKSKVGLTSLETMMDKMHADCKIEQENEQFTMTLLFPISQ